MTAELDPAQVADAAGTGVLAPATPSATWRRPTPTPGQVTFSYTAVAGSSTPLQPVQTVSTVTITVTAADPARNSAPNAADPGHRTGLRRRARSASRCRWPASTRTATGWSCSRWSSRRRRSATPRSPAPTPCPTRRSTIPGVDRIRVRGHRPGRSDASPGRSPCWWSHPARLGPAAGSRRTWPLRSGPARSIRIDPLSVVTDPGGQPVQLATPAFTASAELQVEVDDQSLIVTAPPDRDGGEPAVHRGQRQGADGVRIGEGDGLRRTPRSRRRSPPTSSSGPPTWPRTSRPSTSTSSASITNRSGRRDELTVSVDELSAGTGQSRSAPQVIRVTVTPVRQIVAYQVTDTYGSTRQRVHRGSAAAATGRSAADRRGRRRSGWMPDRASTCRSATTSPSAAAGRPASRPAPAPRIHPGHRGAELRRPP